MKIVLLGKDGQVGRELQNTLASIGTVLAYNRQQADLEQPSQIIMVIRENRPDIIVNAAAYTAVDKAESDSERAAAINRDAVAVMAEEALRLGALLVHYSTDYVFDGTKNTAYLETDKTHPTSIYGASKRAGEEAIDRSGCRALVFRTSWVYSRHGHNFVKTILRLATERSELNVVADQFGAPTAAAWIAEATATALSNALSGQLAPGLYHMTATGDTSWFDFARLIVDRALVNGASLRLRPSDIHPIATADYPLPANRPHNSRLDTTLLSSALKQDFPHWTVHALRTIDQLTATSVTS